MKHWEQVIEHATFRFIDHTRMETFEERPYTALTSFAIDDALALSVSNELSPPVIRMWTHPETVVLGIPDSRLPFIKDGVRMLKAEGYHVIVRNSGGLAVALDEGVLNISLVLPDTRRLSIDEGYEAMLHFIQYMLSDITTDIQAYEIVGSYCPGDYDLSIDGVKFAGISQRRVRDGAAIQIYLDVEGNSQQRAELIRNFYHVSKQDAETSFVYPTVNPKVMGSISDLTHVPLTVEDMKDRVRKTIERLSTRIITEPFSSYEREQFAKRYKQMVQRNASIQVD